MSRSQPRMKRRGRHYGGRGAEFRKEGRRRGEGSEAVSQGRKPRAGLDGRGANSRLAGHLTRLAGGGVTVLPQPRLAARTGAWHTGFGFKEQCNGIMPCMGQRIVAVEKDQPN